MTLKGFYQHLILRYSHDPHGVALALQWELLNVGCVPDLSSTDRLIRWYTDILIYWYTDTLTSCFTTVVVAIYIFICIHIYDLHGLVDLLYTQVFSGMINRKLVYTTIYRYGYIIYIYTHIHTNLIFRFAMIPHDIRNITMSCMDPSTFWGSIWGI